MWVEFVSLDSVINKLSNATNKYCFTDFLFLPFQSILVHPLLAMIFYTHVLVIMNLT